MTFYIIGLVIALLVSLSLLVWGIVNEEEARLGIDSIVIISLFSWLSIFIMVMAAIFIGLKKEQ